MKLCLFGLFVLLCLPALATEPTRLDVPQFGNSPVYTPEITQPAGMIALLSPSTGWDEASTRIAEHLAAQNYIVLGLDVKNYYADPDHLEDECLYPSGIIEEQSQDLQRRYTSSRFQAPTIIGLGDSGGLAALIALQTMPSTYSAAIAPNFCPILKVAKPLCTGERLRIRKGGYQLKTTTPVEKLFLKTDPTCKVAQKGWPTQNTADEQTTFIDISLKADAAAKPPGDTISGLEELPLAYLPAPDKDWLVIFISGDGGWRDIDRQIGDTLHKAGYAVIGIDSLHYFWHEKSPTETAAMLDKMIQTATSAWQKKRVALMGYSFGADLLPQILGHMKMADRVKNLSLLGLSPYGGFEITAGSFLGSDDLRYDNLKAFQQLKNPPATLCIYGADEDLEDTLCPNLKPFPWAKAVMLPGDHHFNQDYAKVTRHIITQLEGSNP